MDKGKLALRIAKRLDEHFGRVNSRLNEPVETLVETILSQNTNDGNRDRAYRSLIDRFGTLEAVKTANVEEIADAIRIGGLHRGKAHSIKESLRRISEKQGSLALSFLSELDTEGGLDWLLSLPGVGNKTAGIVLLFSLGKPYFPVDTHIRRVLNRVGLIEAGEDPHRVMNAILPPDPDLMQGLHLHLIELGRTVCRPRRPDCTACPLTSVCAFEGKGENDDERSR